MPRRPSRTIATRRYAAMSLAERFRLTADAIDFLGQRARGGASMDSLAREIGFPSRQAVWNILERSKWGTEPTLNIRRQLAIWFLSGPL